MNPNWGAIWALTVLVLGAVLLTGCDDGSPAVPDPVEVVDTTGTVGPMIGTNGRVGIGIDLGGGLYINPSNGGLGFGF